MITKSLKHFLFQVYKSDGFPGSITASENLWIYNGLWMDTETDTYFHSKF